MKREVQTPRLRPFIPALGYPIFVAAMFVVGGSLMRDCESAPAPPPTPAYGGCSPGSYMASIDSRGAYTCVRGLWQEVDAGVPDAAPDAGSAWAFPSRSDTVIEPSDTTITGKLIVGTGCRRVEIQDGMVMVKNDCTPGRSFDMDITAPER